MARPDTVAPGQLTLAELELPEPELTTIAETMSSTMVRLLELNDWTVDVRRGFAGEGYVATASHPAHGGLDVMRQHEDPCGAVIELVKGCVEIGRYWIPAAA